MSIPSSESYPLQAALTASVGETTPFFSKSAETGRYDAAKYVWTPGRDAMGAITQKSFDLLPVGPWIEVEQTAFVNQVKPLLRAALPTYNDPGASDLADVLDDYSGFAHDADGGRVFAHGGGHQGSANNGLYRFDLRTMSWAIAKLPDMPTHWPANYKTNPPRDNSYSVYTRAQDYCKANPTTTVANYDMFFDPIEPAADTRNPTARHTYAGMTFAGGKLRHGVRQYWEWDESTNTWSRKFPFNKNFATHGKPGGGSTGEAVKGTWDEVNMRYICGPFWNGTPGGFWGYNTLSNTWQWMSNLPTGWEAYVAAACRKGRSWCLFARPTTNKNYFWPPTLHIWDLDTQFAQTIRLSGLKKERCIDANRYDESTIMEYVPEINRIFLLMPYDLNERFPNEASLPLVPFLIDLDAASITPEAQLGAFPPLNARSLVKNKFFYSEKLRALVMVPNSGSNVRIRRYA